MPETEVKKDPPPQALKPWMIVVGAIVSAGVGAFTLLGNYNARVESDARRGDQILNNAKANEQQDKKIEAIAAQVQEVRQSIIRLAPLAEKGAEFASTWPTVGRTTEVAQHKVMIEQLEKRLTLIEDKLWVMVSSTGWLTVAKKN